MSEQDSHMDNQADLLRLDRHSPSSVILGLYLRESTIGRQFTVFPLTFSNLVYNLHLHERNARSSEGIELISGVQQWLDGVAGGQKEPV